MKNKVFPCWKKVVAFFAAIITGIVTVLAVVSIFWYIEEKYYEIPKTQLQSKYFDTKLEHDVYDAVTCYLESGSYNITDTNLSYLTVENEKGKVICDYQNSKANADSLYIKNVTVYVDTEEKFIYYGHSDGEFAYAKDNKKIKKWNAQIALSKRMVINDEYRAYQFFIDVTWALRFLVYPLGLIAFVLFFWSMIYLFSAVGHYEKGDSPHGTWETKIPLDVLTVAFLFIGYIYCCLIYWACDYFSSYMSVVLAVFTVGAVGCAMICLYYLVSIAIRIKMKVFWSNNLSIITCRAIFRSVGFFIDNKTITVKIGIALLGLGIVEFMGVCYIGFNSTGGLFVCIFAEKILLWGILSKLIVPIKELLRAGEKLAAGDLAYQIDTSKMYWDVKKHGENLNKISTGMTIAVEQKMSSERMKTELITNVSHDIKTPLTSIINYTDLISKEKTDNKKIGEYVEVLNRQAQKLKRLIEDLVEASKATTGNLEVDLVPCDASIFVAQAQGEYEEKLEKAQLTLITKLSEQEMKIMADGRRMWRVFDNLLNNICKYSVKGSRVYLNLDRQGQFAVILFKNTSREQLDLKPEELMERFVRGDKSRNSEGNGLGLSIAQSLTELQGGEMEIITDGDLFKVVLRFPVLE